MIGSVPTAGDLRAAFDAVAPLTVGLEEELFLVDGATLDLVPRGAEVAAALDDRFKPELPAAQIEIVTAPATAVRQAVADLERARRELRTACPPGIRPLAAGLHPFAAPIGELNRGDRYDVIASEYRDVARQQLVAALQVHVAVGDSDRALAVYNALRSELPLLAALAANAPFHGGRDTGLASWRPVVSGMLPRQGIPPALESWQAYADALAAVGDPARWWWELRPHPLHGTLEIRVADTQTTVADAAAVAVTAHALVAWLAERHASGETLPVTPRWRIEQDRWEAARRGTAGPLGERVAALLDELAPVAERLGGAAELAAARRLAERPGWAAQRAAAADGGVRAVAAWLAVKFDEVIPGEAGSVG